MTARHPAPAPFDGSFNGSGTQRGARVTSLSAWTMPLLRIGVALFLALSGVDKLVNLLSMLASWKQMLDPWGFLGLTKGSQHLFLASLVVTSPSIVLVLNAREDYFTMDRALRERRHLGHYTVVFRLLPMSRRIRFRAKNKDMSSA